MARHRKTAFENERTKKTDPLSAHQKVMPPFQLIKKVMTQPHILPAPSGRNNEWSLILISVPAFLDSLNSNVKLQGAGDQCNVYTASKLNSCNRNLIGLAYMLNMLDCIVNRWGILYVQDTAKLKRNFLITWFWFLVELLSFRKISIVMWGRELGMRIAIVLQKLCNIPILLMKAISIYFTFNILYRSPRDIQLPSMTYL